MVVLKGEMAKADQPTLAGTGSSPCDDVGDQAHSSIVAGDGLYVTASPSTLASDTSSSNNSLEYETARMIEKSREQGWSELKDWDHFSDAAATSSNDNDTRVIWEELKRRDPWFFREDVGMDLEVGRLIAEGGQAYIYEAKITGPWWKLAVKVYKSEGFSLADLQRQWPPASKDSTLRHSPLGLGFVVSEGLPNCIEIHCGTFLKDGRFAFLMGKYWGDLRTLINRKLSDNNDNERPPFSHPQALQIMHQIAHGMKTIHSKGVLHRDLKAANVLVRVSTNQPDGVDKYFCYVADFEGSMLIQGTRFWRAPEVLVELMKPCDQNANIWTEKVDVYCYAMTCYEVFTGLIPFPQYFKSDWKKVIDGERPHLPHYLEHHPQLQQLLNRCWHKEPLQRPDFKDIIVELRNIRNLPTYKL